MRQLHQELDQRDDQHDITLDRFLFPHRSIHQVQRKQDHFVRHRAKQFSREVVDIEDDLHCLSKRYLVELQFLGQPIIEIKQS